MGEALDLDWPAYGEGIMKLLRVAWQNYRRLPDAVLAVRNHLVLVGPNDCGKSSLLRAIHLCLGVPGAQLPSAIQDRDFTDRDRVMRLEMTLHDLSEDERAAFPDEVSVGQPDTLRIAVEAEIDPNDPDVMSIRRFFPDSGHLRSLSRVQIDTIGWAFVPATRSLLRELGSSGGSAVQSLLAGLDLTADADAIATAAEQFRTMLDQSSALTDFRRNLAEALSRALPRDVAPGDLRITTEGELSGDPFSGLTVTIDDNGVAAPLAEQSDGVRALSLLALLAMSQRSARIVGLDEPETHLHTSAQRAVGRSLTSNEAQRVVATHSPALLSRVSPLDVVALGADRRARQLPEDGPMTEIQLMTRHWSHRLLDPLTARSVFVVEGAADRIVCEQVAKLSGLDLDRLSVAVFELDGADFFPTAWKLFGPPGFDLPMSGLVDEDHHADWARAMGVQTADLHEHGIVVARPDLEGMCIALLGSDRIFTFLALAGISVDRICEALGVADASGVSDSDLASYVGHKRRKMRFALAIARGMTSTDAAQFAELAEVLSRAAS